MVNHENYMVYYAVTMINHGYRSLQWDFMLRFVMGLRHDSDITMSISYNSSFNILTRTKTHFVKML